MPELIRLCAPIGVILACLVGIRYVAALFSEESKWLIEKRPNLHFALFFCGMGMLALGVYGPDLIERHTQRKFVFETIQTKGGWAEFNKECALLIKEYQPDKSDPWFQPAPASYPLLAGLHPRQVKVTQASHEMVIVKVFGAHATGIRGTPYYALVHVPSGDKTALQDSFGKLTVRKVAESVFEIY